MTNSELSFPSRSPEEERERLIARLEPRILELAERRGAEGITASDFLAECYTNGWLTRPPKGRERDHSFVGPVMVSLSKRGFLAPMMAGAHVVRRRSSRLVSHGNLGVVWLRTSAQQGAA